MKYLIAAVLLALSTTVKADDPGPLAPCYQLLSNGWELLRLRNNGVPIETIIVRIERQRAPEDEKADAIAFVREVWEAPGDGWDWIGEKHRACIRWVKYHQEQK